MTLIFEEGALPLQAVHQLVQTAVEYHLHTLFSYGGVHNRPRYLAMLARGVFTSRAAPPRMRWLPKRNFEQQKTRF